LKKFIFEKKRNHKKKLFNRFYFKKTKKSYKKSLKSLLILIHNLKGEWSLLDPPGINHLTKIGEWSLLDPPLVNFHFQIPIYST